MASQQVCKNALTAYRFAMEIWTGTIRPEMLEIRNANDFVLNSKQKTNNLKPDVAHCQYP